MSPDVWPHGGLEVLCLPGPLITAWHYQSKSLSTTNMILGQCPLFEHFTVQDL